MTSHLDMTRIGWRCSLLIVLGLLAMAGTQVAADDAASSSDTYTWSAELVAFDDMAKTATVQTRLVSHAEIEDLSGFSEGDQVMLKWSGAYSSASGVRNVTRDTMVDEGDRFAMPVEFVSTQMDNRYITFKVPVPSRDVEKIKALEPGEWVTATSPHEPSDQTTAITQIHPYSS